MAKKVYDRLTKNLIKRLSRGEEVLLGNITLKREGERLILKGRIEEGEEVELFFRLEKGGDYGLSKAQLKRIISMQEKPIFRAHIRK